MFITLVYGLLIPFTYVTFVHHLLILCFLANLHSVNH